MSTQRITRFPPEILFVIIGSVDNPADLLALGLTCRFIYEMVIPHYLSYFRIVTQVGNIGLWKHLSQSLHLCRNIQEFELTGSNPSVYRNPLKYDSVPWSSATDTQTTSSDLPVIMQQMVNLRRAKFQHWSYSTFEVFRDILHALIDSIARHRLEELDILLTIPDSSVIRTMDPETLQIWSKLNLAVLQKLSITTLTTADRNRQPGTLSREVNSIVNMLSNAPVLTHLDLTVRAVHTVVQVVNLFDFTCPNLENVIIRDRLTLLPMNTPQDPSILIGFFNRHPKLTTLSLPSYVYVATSSPYITPESLPRLESFAYNEPVQVPLSHVLSPASARTLRHLTISEKDASLQYSDMGIYRELTSLQTCCFTSETWFPTNYENINQILTSFVAHVTDVQKIHLPILLHRRQNLQDSVFLETLSILQRLPKLTHLSGISRGMGNATQDLLIQELYCFSQLKYVIDPSPPLSVLQLTRDNRTKCMWINDGLLARKNSDRDMTTWGNFYRGIEFY